MAQNVYSNAGSKLEEPPEEASYLTYEPNKGHKTKAGSRWLPLVPAGCRSVLAPAGSRSVLYIYGTLDYI